LDHKTLFFYFFQLWKKILFNFDSLIVNSILYEWIQMHWFSIMIFFLGIIILDRFLRILYEFHQLFKPFGNYSQDSVGFNKKDSIFYLLISVFRCIFTNFSTNKIFCVWFNFFSIVEIIICLITSFFWTFLSFAWHDIKKLELFPDIIWKSTILLRSRIDHVIDNSHYLRRIVSISPIGKQYLWFSNKIVSNFTLILYGR